MASRPDIAHFGASSTCRIPRRRGNTFASAPLVLVTNGYDLIEGTTPVEVTELVGGGQLAVEYRYNGMSVPASDPMFEQLTVENGAADLNRWVTEFRRFFNGRFLSTGRSRSGMVALEHRAFHPADVDGTVGYVVPDIDGVTDARWDAALQNVGPASCHAALEALQQQLLGPRRAGVVNVIETGLVPIPVFTRFGGAERAYEAIVESLGLSFWQSYGFGGTCATMPDGTTATDGQLVNFLNRTEGLSVATDQSQERFAPYYFIAARQTGIPALPRSHISGLLMTGAPTLEQGTLPASVPAPTFAGTADAFVDGWVENEAQQVLFIHGELDGWGAVRQPTAAARQVVEYEVAGAGHYGATIEALSSADRSAATELIRGWAAP